MRGILFIIITISLLVIGVLVMKNMQSGPDDMDKKELVDHAQKTVDEAEKSMQKLSDKIRQTQ